MGQTPLVITCTLITPLHFLYNEWKKVWKAFYRTESFEINEYLVFLFSLMKHIIYDLLLYFVGC